MKVTVFSTTTCPYCKTLKDYLDEKGVEYVEKLIDQDGEAKKVMLEASGGFLGVPFTVIEKTAGPEASGPGGGTKDTVVGFDKNKLNQVLGLD